MPPRVSIVMPVFRPDRRFLEEAIASVISQSMPDWELIVVEDPSDACGKDVVVSRQDARIRYIGNTARTGLARQHNLAVKESTADLIARFDADDVCEPDRLAKQIAYLEANPSIDVVSSQLTIIDAEGAVIGQRDYPLAHDDIVHAMHRFNPISGSNVMFRRRVVQSVGGWREGIDRPAQDYEWYSRVATRGFRFGTHPDRLVRYRRHGGQIKSTRLRGTIITTLEVKHLYWRHSMDLRALLTFAGECAMLALPAPVVLWLLTLLRYKRAP
ncbi:MAG: glycosyltransferase [Gammaproteobacteria bacterium]|nr:glycosyltransferase [Gammaproteobacteria bacterium]